MPEQVDAGGAEGPGEDKRSSGVAQGPALRCPAGQLPAQTAAGPADQDWKDPGTAEDGPGQEQGQRKPHLLLQAQQVLNLLMIFQLIFLIYKKTDSLRVSFFIECLFERENISSVHRYSLTL